MLSKCEIVPKRVLKVLKIPIYTAYSFATTHPRNWITKAKKKGALEESLISYLVMEHPVII